MNFSRYRIACSILSILGTAALVAMADPANAALNDPTDLPTVAVHYADRDLTSESGRHALETRISAAATRVCETQMPGVMMVDDACRQAAIVRARRDVGLTPDTRNG